MRCCLVFNFKRSAYSVLNVFKYYYLFVFFFKNFLFGKNIIQIPAQQLISPALLPVKFQIQTSG